MRRFGLALVIYIGLVGQGGHAIGRVEGEPLYRTHTSSTSSNQVETPEQVIERLLSLPHGLIKLSPGDRVRLRQVRDNPTPYIIALNSLYAGRNPAAIKDPEEALRFERAVSLLAFIGTNQALSQIAGWYKTLDQPSLQPTPNDRNRALHLQRVILSSLKALKQEEIISSILTQLQKMDTATRLAALEYLGRSATNDARIINELRKILNDRQSPLYQDRTLKRSIESLSKPK